MNTFFAKIKLLLSIFLSQIVFFIYAQQNPVNNEKLSIKERIFFGGNIGLQFGTITQIDLSPLIGYRVSERFSSGIGITYQYYSDSRFDFNTDIYGGRVFGRYFIYEDFFAHAEFEVLSLETELDRLNLYPDDDRFLIHSVLVGGGYRQKIGQSSSINFMVLYNLNQSSNSPYQNPIIRIGSVSYTHLTLPTILLV